MKKILIAAAVAAILTLELGIVLTQVNNGVELNILNLIDNTQGAQ